LTSVDRAIHVEQDWQRDAAPQKSQPAGDQIDTARRHDTCLRLTANRKRQLRLTTSQAVERPEYNRISQRAGQRRNAAAATIA
jgi:hypothetical protein